MKKYFVVSFEICFGFGGFVRKAFLSIEQARAYLNAAPKNNYTGAKIYSVMAPTAKAAINAGPSMFAGAFRGIDISKA